MPFVFTRSPVNATDQLAVTDALCPTYCFLRSSWLFLVLISYVADAHSTQSPVNGKPAALARLICIYRCSCFDLHSVNTRLQTSLMALVTYLFMYTFEYYSTLTWYAVLLRRLPICHRRCRLEVAIKKLASCCNGCSQNRSQTVSCTPGTYTCAPCSDSNVLAGYAEMNVRDWAVHQARDGNAVSD